MKNTYLITFLISIAFIVLTTTCKKNTPVTLTILGNSEVSEITSNSAVLTGTTLEIGENMQVYGHVWGENENPDISHFKSEHTETETGIFSDELSELKPETKYYVRPYAKDGDEIIYKDAVYFTTLPDIQIITVVTNEISEISYIDATCGGLVTNEGESSVSARGVCWSKNENPTVDDSKTENGTGLGAFESTLSELTDNITYYVRAYATNNEGTVYGEQKIFVTKEKTIPTITTNEIIEITSISAVCGGNISENGGSNIIERGICYSIIEQPTVEDTKVIDGFISTGSYTSLINDLSSYTNYYVRAYAINDIGISYGEQLSFITLIGIGTFYNGGIVFYIDEENEHGLVCSVLYQSNAIKWYNGEDIETGATDKLIWTGMANTDAIIFTQGNGDYAAKICDDLSLNDYDDWFLPSTDELNELYKNKDIINAACLNNEGEILSTSYHWSSSESTATGTTNAWTQRFNDGTRTTILKSTEIYVRAVRAF